MSENGLPIEGGESQFFFLGIFLTAAPLGPQRLHKEPLGDSRDPFFVISGRFLEHFGAFLAGDCNFR